jgi:hypothetical protein
MRLHPLFMKGELFDSAEMNILCVLDQIKEGQQWNC